MLRKHILQLRIVKEEPNTPRYGVPAQPIDIPIDQINKVVENTLIRLGIAFVAVSACTTVLAIAKETAIITAEAKIG